jgi:hypothetical protein
MFLLSQSYAICHQFCVVCKPKHWDKLSLDQFLLQEGFDIMENLSTSMKV